MREALAWGLVLAGMLGLGVAAPRWHSPSGRARARVLATAVALSGVILVYGLHSHTGPQLGVNPIPADAASIGRGRAVFAEQCAPCHGDAARGDGPRAPLLRPAPSDLIAHVPQHGDSELFGWIVAGFPQSAMPAFRGTLTDAQMWDVINYLRSAVGDARR